MSEIKKILENDCMTRWRAHAVSRAFPGGGGETTASAQTQMCFCHKSVSRSPDSRKKKSLSTCFPHREAFPLATVFRASHFCRATCPVSVPSGRRWCGSQVSVCCLRESARLARVKKKNVSPWLHKSVFFCLCFLFLFFFIQ